MGTLHLMHAEKLGDRLSNMKYSLKHLKGWIVCTTPSCRAASSKNNQALHLQKCHPDTETKLGKRSDLKAWHDLTNLLHSLSTLKAGRQHTVHILFSTWIFDKLELDLNNLIMINNNIMLQNLICQDPCFWHSHYT